MDALRPAVERGEERVVAAVSARLESVQLDGVCEKWMEEADGVRAAADTSHGVLGEPAVVLQHLSPRLDPDHPLQLTDEPRVGVRTDRRAEEVVGSFGIGDPVA